MSLPLNAIAFRKKRDRFERSSIPRKATKVTIMGKSHDAKKETKKAPKMSAKEKKAAKKAKK